MWNFLSVFPDVLSGHGNSVFSIYVDFTGK